MVVVERRALARSTGPTMKSSESAWLGRMSDPDNLAWNHYRRFEMVPTVVRFTGTHRRNADLAGGREAGKFNSTARRKLRLCGKASGNALCGWFG
ncbi:hypothetical protein ACFOVU_27495, partial [Nocardiopsis sediminis]